MLQIRALVRVTALYLLWVVMHYAAAHVYTELCVPPTLKGFMMSPFMTATPHCAGMRWLMQTGASSINAIWLILGAVFIKYITPIEK